ncbi:PepSY-associated TM helix domain-containing protein [Mesobacterium pallidum]|uniref:PepSY-associated TM helix domain-containing protein n=1 Tax=Mesobacterium pallidum TaxID=2872037 RepID=UPI001EE37054|nr:PepSY-associated TM helix domain-containing protein [Mesobacterium pallidum]
MFRPILFWSHLVAGFVAGVFVLLMAVTGVILTYESQIVDAVVASAVDAPAGAEPLDADALARASGAQPGQALLLSADPTEPAGLAQGRRSVPLDPYTGEAMTDAGAGTQAFFGAVTSLHRWLTLSGSSEIGGGIIGAANLLFGFLLLSGAYLWLPRIYRRSQFRLRLMFQRDCKTTQARDFNWHHVLGFWAMIPLFVIVLSGVVMSYSWANQALFAVVGEEAPVRRGPPTGAGPSTGIDGGTLSGPALPLATLVGIAAMEVPGSNTARITLPEATAATVAITMDRGNGRQAAQQTRLVLDRESGEILSEDSGDAGTLGSRLRGWMRFAHTGEVYGVIGQTIAGLASLAAALLVWTGIAMGYRRLTRMAQRRRSAPAR